MTGPVDLHFAIYKEQTDAAPLWQETQTLQVDEQGRYRVLLGAMQPEGVPLELFASGEARWLGVAAGNLPEQPRTLLVSVPYALKANDAEMLGGKPASAYLMAQPEATSGAGTTVSSGGAATPGMATRGKNPKGRKPDTTTVTPCTSVTSDGTATANSVALFTTACNVESSVINQVSGMVGIGTTTPAAALQVASGNLRLSAAYPVIEITTGQPLYISQISGARGFLDTAGQNIGLSKINPTYGVLESHSAYGMAFNIDGSTKMAISGSTGNVGIGTPTPAATLDVAGNINSSGSVTAASFSGSGAGLTNVGGSTTVITGSTATLSGDLDLPQTTSASAGVINLGGSSFLHACCDPSNTFVGTRAGNFTTTGVNNTASGYQALFSNTTGSDNTASG